MRSWSCLYILDINKTVKGAIKATITEIIYLPQSSLQPPCYLLAFSHKQTEKHTSNKASEAIKFWILFTVLPLILRQWADHLRSSSPAFSLPGDWHLIREHTILWLNKESQQLSLKGLFLILSYSGASPFFSKSIQEIAWLSHAGWLSHI